ncbi:MAG: regulatory protein RecX [Anaerolineales bacterium]|nr:regulatory protein RecX [Anaerolineales bacterium]
MEHRITALTLQKRNHQRVNVYLDGEFAFGLARIVAAWLQVGQVITDEKIAQLRAEDERETAFQSALRLIQLRPRSENEIRQKLLQRKEKDDVIQAVIERLKQSGLLNDEVFARDWIENRAELRPRSRRALAYELSQRGVERSVIETNLAEINDDEMAYRAAQNKARKFKDLDWSEFRLKLYRYLAQRGFDYAASQQAISRVWQEMHDAETIPEDDEGFL